MLSPEAIATCRGDGAVGLNFRLVCRSKGVRISVATVCLRFFGGGGGVFCWVFFVTPCSILFFTRPAAKFRLLLVAYGYC